MKVTGWLRLTLVVAILVVPSLFAQDAKEAVAPVPPLIQTGKTVFISNAGEDATQPESFSGGPNRAYNQFYAAMKSWGRYEIVPSPAQADLIFEIEHINLSVTLGVHNSDDPRLRLRIFDPRNHILLWGMTEHFSSLGRKKTRDTSFDVAMNTLMDDVKKLARQPEAEDKK